jgi:hypothetical protein
MGSKISSVYLFLAVDPNGDESVPAFSDGDVFMPLVGTDPARVDELREIAKQMSRDPASKSRYAGSACAKTWKSSTGDIDEGLRPLFGSVGRWHFYRTDAGGT